MKNKFENEKWEMLEYSWSDTSIYNQDNEIICTLSIDNEDTTEENQEEREQIVSERFKLISKAPKMLSLLIDVHSHHVMKPQEREKLGNLIKEIQE